ncbi:MAG: glycosyltransferase [Bacteroidia bacterium]|nr:glycosyltransferase [Bacteroidia bacterium]
MTTRPRIAHVAFNQALKLPVLIAELRSLRNEMDIELVVPSYDQRPAELEALLDGVRVRFVRLLSREWSARQTAPLKLLRFLEFTVKAWWTLVTGRSDLYVGHDMPGMLPLLPYVLFSPRSVVFAAHELWTEAAEDNAPARPLWRMLERWIVRRAGLVIVPEENRARIIFEEYGSKAAPAVVRNIPEEVVDVPRGSLLRDLLGISADAVIVLYQGLVSDTRCLRELAQSLASLPPHVHIVIVGEGDTRLRSDLEDIAADTRGRLRLLPWMPPDELRAFTASADVGVLLYRNNGRNNYFAAPNKLYEYLFAGLPLVSSAFPGLQAIIEGSGFGVCANPDDPGDIARAILEASTIPAGESIASAARQRFRWTDEAAVLRSIYAELLEARHAG